MQGIIVLGLTAANIFLQANSPTSIPVTTMERSNSSHTARTHHLVNLSSLKIPPVLDIRYATTNNFTGEKLYPFPAAFALRDTAAAIARVQAELAKRGLRLKIYDAYRPLSVQKRMWSRVPDPRYVANPFLPPVYGHHTHGTAVDVTLVDQTGRELPMPSEFDCFSEKASRSYTGGTVEQRRNSEYLKEVMTRHGFIANPSEWWHFDLRGWERYPALDIPFQELVQQ